MKAIVLTFDKQIGFAELLYKKYMSLWQNCPFQFQVAYNDEESIPNSLKNKGNINLLKTESDIRSTMSSLLEKVEDDEWVYWCIDDRYPTYIDVPVVKSIIEFIECGKADSMELNSIKLMNWKEKKDETKNVIEVGSRSFNYQKWREPGNLWGFWHHRFDLAKNLKTAFLNNNLPKEYKIGDIQVYHEMSDVGFLENTIYPSGEFILKLSEPCMRGKLTENGILDLKQNNCKVPNYEIMDCSKTFVNSREQSVKKQWR